jgi:hypothetical protein
MVVAAVLVVAAASLAWVGWRSSGRFERVRWQVASKGYCKDERGAMVGDVRRRYLHTRVSQRSVAKLLGKPEYANLERSAAPGRVWWSWNIGRDFIDCATLDLLFANHRLVRTEIGHT